MNWQEKRRDDRIDVIPGKDLAVHLMNPEGDNEASTMVVHVRNVSRRGCHLVFDSVVQRAKASMGKVFIASLIVGDFPIPLKLKVVRWVGEAEAGVEFRPPFPKELEKLDRFMEPRFLGRSLREINPKALQNAVSDGMRWFQGINETNLFSWDEQQQLIFLDHVVEWKGTEDVRTGRIRQDNAGLEGDVKWVKSDLLDFDPRPDLIVINQARAMLDASSIDAAVKKRFLEKISRHSGESGSPAR